MYRVLTDLGPFPDGSVLKAGSLSSLSKTTPKAIAILLERGAVAEWQAPPLAILPGWDRKAKAFEEVGIKTVSDLLKVDATQVAKKLETSVEVVSACIKEARAWAK